MEITSSTQYAGEQNHIIKILITVETEEDRIHFIRVLDSGRHGVMLPLRWAQEIRDILHNLRKDGTVFDKIRTLLREAEDGQSK